MKLWEKGTSTSVEIAHFTVGDDRTLDLVLAAYDVVGSMAHVAMLEKIDLLPSKEWRQLHDTLREIYQQVSDGKFVIEDQVEDVHSQVEFIVTGKLGGIGKKIHSGRSRNDQILLDIKLFLRDEIQAIVRLTEDLIKLLLALSETHKEVIIPGYTHLQAAMPSSFGLWFGAFAETLVDDLRLLLAAYRVTNQNPLGSAAGYGNSFPLDREFTTELLGFADPHINVVAAQLSRGKTETSVAFGLAALGGTLNKMATDICLYNSQNFDFMSFPDHITTGSSIMPHKKNPDVFELIRGRCNLLQQMPSQMIAVTSNLPSGYHRDMQLTKEVLLPGLQHLKQCLSLAKTTLKEVNINQEVIDDKRYELIYSVENVNKYVLAGVPFREAYQQVAADIAQGTFTPEKHLQHNHLGSIGNLGTKQIAEKMAKVLGEFDFDHYEQAIQSLLQK